MKLVKQVQLKQTNLLNDLCIRSKNLFNLANYVIRWHFFNTHRWVRYNELYERLRTHEAYVKFKELAGSHAPQQLLKQLDQSWKSFFNSMKAWKRDKSKFKTMPRIPCYKRKNGKHCVIFTKLQCRVKEDNFLLIKRLMNKGFPKIPLENIPINESNYIGARLIPYCDRYVFEMIYQKERVDLELDNNNVVGIDLGVNNLITVSNNIGLKPLIVNGGVAKSVNQYYNKQLAHYKSVAKQMNDKHITKRINKLHRVRNKKIRDIFHKTSRKIVNYCIENDIGTIVAGYNEGWKQGVSMGKRNNQNFVNLPFLKLVKQLEYKGELVGIKVVRTTEEYTSQRCSNCGIVKKSNRKHRGLYVCSECGLVINADVNAAKNILNKGISDSEGIGDRGCLDQSVVVAV